MFYFKEVLVWIIFTNTIKYGKINIFFALSTLVQPLHHRMLAQNKYPIYII